MKNIIILITFVFVSATTSAQKDSTAKIYIDSTISLGKIGTGLNGVPMIFWSDSTIEIKGDTIKAIRLLYKEYNKMSEKYWAAWNILSKLNLKYLSEFLKSKSFTYAVREWNKIKD